MRLDGKHSQWDLKRYELYKETWRAVLEKKTMRTEKVAAITATTSGALINTESRKAIRNSTRFPYRLNISVERVFIFRKKHGKIYFRRYHMHNMSLHYLIKKQSHTESSPNSVRRLHKNTTMIQAES